MFERNCCFPRQTNGLRGSKENRTFCNGGGDGWLTMNENKTDVLESNYCYFHAINTNNVNNGAIKCYFC